MSENPTLSEHHPFVGREASGDEAHIFSGLAQVLLLSCSLATEPPEVSSVTGGSFRSVLDISHLLSSARGEAGDREKVSGLKGVSYSHPKPKNTFHTGTVVCVSFQHMAHLLLLGMMPFSSSWLSLPIRIASQFPSLPSYSVSTTLKMSPREKARHCGCSFS